MRKTSGKLKTLYNWLLINKRLPDFFPSWAKLPREDDGYSSRVVTPDGVVRLVVEGASLPISDHIEMSGYTSSHLISYNISEEREFFISIHSVYPNYRMKPNVTEASYSHNFIVDSKVYIDGEERVERVRFSDIKGVLSFISDAGKVEIRRTYYPAVYTTAIIEKIEVENLSEEEVKVEVNVPTTGYISLPKFSDEGVEYISRMQLADDDGKMMEGFEGKNSAELKPEECEVFYVVYYTRPSKEDILVDVTFELKKREEFIDSIFNGVRIETGNKVFDQAFSHTVLRGSESIFNTKQGLMHCPGGGSYYGAIWTNDNVEYSAPFFGYSGRPMAKSAILNGIRLFAEEFDKKKGIPSSIASCGDSVWRLAGDRGDSQMYASGSARFALACGDRVMAEEIMVYVKECIEYTKSKTDKNGIVYSDSDELEGRFSSGKANLSTNCLAYDMYLNASYLVKALGKMGESYEYYNLAMKQRSAIVKYFGGTVEGYETFKYFKSNNVLRSWICMPMCVGINDNSSGTVSALYGEKLYHNATLKTASNRNVIWDRSLLFALRGSFKAGFTDKSYEVLKDYTYSRFLGCHAPYPYEAYPEGNKRHLSAESILYARIYIEGILGLVCEGFGKFSVTPQIPAEWAYFKVKGLVLADIPIDITIENGELIVTDVNKKELYRGYTVNGQRTFIDLTA